MAAQEGKGRSGGRVSDGTICDEGVDVYFLAKQMSTSVKMIEDHYGHITPLKNPEQILKGLPGWETGLPAA